MPPPTPHNLSQWMAYTGVLVVGLLVSTVIQQLFMRKFLGLTKISEEARSRIAKFSGLPVVEDIPLPFRQMATGLSDWVGALEIILYASAVVYNYPEFIVAWFATK